MARQLLGRYDVTEELGHGGMGVVWLARDPTIDRNVAIKVIADRGDDGIPGQSARFCAEMKVLGKLSHKNIVRILDAQIEGGQAYIVMERLKGRDLKTRLKDGEKFPLSRAIDVVRQVLSALEHAHRQSVVHCDIKPANVMLDENDVATVFDFGAARFVELDATIMRWSDVFSPAYASPEQAKGVNLDFRTDLFSTGVMLHELATGHRPEPNTSEAEILRRLTVASEGNGQVVHEPVLVAMAKVLRRALRSNPKERFESASAFSTAIVAAMQEPTPPPPCISREPRPHRAWVVWGPRLIALPFFLGGTATHLVLPPAPESGLVAQAVVQPELMLPATAPHVRPTAARPEAENGPQSAPDGAQQPALAAPAALTINQPGTAPKQPGSVVTTSARVEAEPGRPRTTVSPGYAAPTVENDARRPPVGFAVPMAQEALDATAAVSAALSPVDPPARPTVSDICKGTDLFEHFKCIVRTCAVRSNWNDPECNRKPQEQ